MTRTSTSTRAYLEGTSTRVRTTVTSRDTAISNREPCKISPTGLSRFALSGRSPLFDFPVYRDERRLIGIPNEATPGRFVSSYVDDARLCTWWVNRIDEPGEIVSLRSRSDREYATLCTLNAIPGGSLLSQAALPEQDELGALIGGLICSNTRRIKISFCKSLIKITVCILRNELSTSFEAI